MKGLVAIVLLAVLVAGYVWERGAIGRLRAENDSLLADKLEADRLTAENRELLKLRGAVVAPVETVSSTELLRLRNEVRQLRTQQEEAERLRAANQRAAEEITTGKFAPRRMADIEGAVPREKWVFAGFATPEAAVQSFFAALASGDLEQVVRCASPDGAEHLRREMADDPEKFRKEFDEGLGKIGKLSGFRIIGSHPKGNDDGRIEVLVQVVADGKPMPLPLRRVGNEWKLDD
jgi:hypothetical protein